MFKLQLKNWFLVLSLLTAIIASPIAVTAGVACSIHQKAEHCCNQIEEDHCPPESNAVNQGSHHHAQSDETNNVAATIQNGCYCLKDASPQNSLAKQKNQPTQHFYPVFLPPQLDFVYQARKITFFKLDIFYSTHSALSDLPARAPPVL